jgi:CheY-like chemotaxis protein
VREEPKSQQTSGAQERVLVVEGSDVIEAADREAALGRAAADVDVVLLDLMLPGVSRLEVAQEELERGLGPRRARLHQRARADPRTPALPIAFMSTVVDSKPFNPSLLGARLSSPLDAKEPS